MISVYKPHAERNNVNKNNFVYLIKNDNFEQNFIILLKYIILTKAFHKLQTHIFFY